jgi:twitching motility protein PilI
MPTSAMTTTLQNQLSESGKEMVYSHSSPSWLAVKVSGHGFLLPLSQAGEIYPWVEPHRVPYTNDWFLGVVNLRGSLCGVTSLARYMMIDHQPLKSEQVGAHSTAAVQDKRLIAFHPVFDINTVLAVDQLAGLRSINQMTATAEIGCYIDADQQIWQQMDLSFLAQHPRFISIEAP